jgi:hypothetical protein
MASRLLNILGRAVQSLDAADIATWVASNPVDGSVVHDADNNTLLRFDDATASAVAILGDKPTWSKYAKAYTGTTYVDTELEGATILLFLMDGIVRYQVASAPAPGDEFTFDPDTGTVDIGTNFDSNNLYFLYKSITAPST